MWLLLGVVFTASAVITFVAPISELFKGITILPAVAVLMGSVWQLFRDKLSHERSLELQQRQDLFNLGTTSHMANTVFDKHVEFCEKYLQEVHNTVVTFTREGPTDKGLSHAGELFSLRIEFTAWITPEIEEKLMPFEKAVRSISAKSGFVKVLSQDGPAVDEDQEKHRHKQRSEAIEEMYSTFKSLMDFEDVKVKDEDATVLAVKNKVREILQIQELVGIRSHLISKSFASLNG